MRVACCPPPPPALPGPQPPLPVPPPTQNPLQPSRPVQTVWTGDVGQPLHSHRGVLRRAPGLAELPLWRHLHPPALHAYVVAHAFALAKLHHHASAAGQKRLQGPGHLHLPKAVLTRKVPAHVRAANMRRSPGPPPPHYTAPSASFTISEHFFLTLVCCSVEHRLKPEPQYNLWHHANTRGHAGRNTRGGTITGLGAGPRLLIRWRASRSVGGFDTEGNGPAFNPGRPRVRRNWRSVHGTRSVSAPGLSPPSRRAGKHPVGIEETFQSKRMLKFLGQSRRYLAILIILA